MKKTFIVKVKDRTHGGHLQFTIISDNGDKKELKRDVENMRGNYKVISIKEA